MPQKSAKGEMGMTNLSARGPAATILAVLTGLLAGSGALADSARDWTVYGGDAANTRFSALKQISTATVKSLKVAWAMQLGVLEAQESTPLVIGDTLFVTTSLGPRYVYAVDGRTGRIRWQYNPEIPDDVATAVCCGLVNRGAAYADGRLFVGRLDGFMVALDAKTGKELWKAKVVDYKQGAVITSPPTLVRNLLITGFAGGEYGVRGELDAFDQQTGRLVWKSYMIPGTGEPGSETWPTDDSAKHGGANPWYVGSYDAALNLLYYGTGNAAPYPGILRGADGKDFGKFTNLNTASMVAIDPDSGKIVWHYQMTPHDVWDYDGVNEPVLADLALGGKTIPALMHADRNGFFYVLNRASGALISAAPFTNVTWATGVDLASGRPIEAEDKRPKMDGWARNVCPGMLGAKNWIPMSFSPQTRLAYIPAMNTCMDIAARDPGPLKPGVMHTGTELDLSKPGPGGYLGAMEAWDPVQQKRIWQIKEDLPFVGGALSTAGGLVFYGNMEGDLKAADARTGAVLWRFHVGSGISQGPISYEIDGKQYIAVTAGRLTTGVAYMGAIGDKATGATAEGGALFVFELPYAPAAAH